MFPIVLDEQNAHTEEQELQSPSDFRKDSEEENKDNEKDEDTKELEALSCKCILFRVNKICSLSFLFCWACLNGMSIELTGLLRRVAYTPWNTLYPTMQSYVTFHFQQSIVVYSISQ